MIAFLIVVLLVFNSDTVQFDSDSIVRQDTLFKSSSNRRAITENERIFEELERISDKIETQNNWNVLIPIIVVIIAGILALIQIKANVISEARIKWNEELRKSVSEYISFLDAVDHDLKETIGLSDNEQIKTKMAEYFSKYRRLTELEYQIKMLLNPSQANHKDLLDKLKSVEVEYKKYIVDRTYLIDVSSIEDSIAKSSQIVLQESWDAAKSLNLKEIISIKWK